MSGGSDPQNQGTRRILLRLLATSAMLAGLAAVLFGLGRFGASYATTRWPVAPGRVTRSYVVDEPLSGFTPMIEYDYVVGVHQHRGRGLYRPSIDGEPNSPSGAREPTRILAESVIARYPPGREMLVGYDPVDVRRSVLQPMIRWIMLVPIVVGAGAMAPGMRLLAGEGER